MTSETRIDEYIRGMQAQSEARAAGKTMPESFWARMDELWYSFSNEEIRECATRWHAYRNRVRMGT